MKYEQVVTSTPPLITKPLIHGSMYKVDTVERELVSDSSETFHIS